MNELIRRCAKKSGFSLDNTGIYTAKLEHLPITENMNKFTALIIHECIKVIDETHGSNTLLRPQPYQQIVDNIQKHFGDKE